MPEDSPATDAGRLAQRREFVRRSVLRANRFIAIILGIVVLLGVVLAVLSARSLRNQERAEKAEAEEREKVWHASLAQARAENLNGKAGHREAALAAVRTAAAIRPSMELRNEAITALTQRDMVKEREWQMKPNAYGTLFDPDMKHYIERYDPRVLTLYRTEDHQPVRNFGVPFIWPSANIGDYAFTPTGKHVLIRYNGGGLVLWDVEKGMPLRFINADPRAAAWSWPPSFSADDRLMGLCMKGSAGVQTIYDLEKGEVRELPQVEGGITFNPGFNYVRISPRGDLVATWKNGTITIFDATTGAVKYSLTPDRLATIEWAAWDHAGERLAFTCDDWSVNIWRPGGESLPLNGKAPRVSFAEFSRDGNVLVTSGIDGTTRLWDTISGLMFCELRAFHAAKLSPDGRRLAGGVHRQSGSIWSIANQPAMSLHRGAWGGRSTVWQMDMTPDGRRAIWSTPWWISNGGVEIVDLESGTSIIRKTPESVRTGFRPGHDQYWTAGSGSFKFFTLPPPDAASAPAEDAMAMNVPLPPEITGGTPAFSANGRFLALSGRNRSIAFIDLENLTKAPVMMERVFAGASYMGSSPSSPSGGGMLAMSPDGSRLAAGMHTTAGKPAVFDTASGKVIQWLDCEIGQVTFSPDGRFLAVAGAQRLVCYATADWRKLWEQSREPLQIYMGIAAFSGDSSLIACTLGSALLGFYTPEGEPVARWNIRDVTNISNLRLSADGNRMLAGGLGGRLASVDMKSLRRDLAVMHLDWPISKGLPGNAPVAAASQSLWQPVLLGVVPVSIAAVLGALLLRRQRRLTGEFVEAAEIAAMREQELIAEREVSELKSRFVTTVSHEFRTPLGITMSAVELLRHYEDRLPQEEKKQLFDDIHGATRNMAALMEQVLVLGRVDAGKLACKPAPLDIDALARKLTDESLSATSHKCPITWTAVNDLNGAHADESLLRHILTNLLNNAVKYSPAGNPVLFWCRREGSDAVFTVQDHGIGIPEADLPHLFEAFHRGGNVGDIPGTGLGLVIIKRCADLHRGSISVQSQPGSGTTFILRIPAWCPSLK